MTARDVSQTNGPDDNAAIRLRCIQQITAVDEETLQIVRSVLDRLQLTTKPERKKRTRKERPDVGGVE